MELLGVGPLELILVLVIVLLLFSPKDIVGGARRMGSALNKLYKSDMFQVVQKTSEELRNLPNRLAQEAALDELKTLPQEITREVKQATDVGKISVLPKPAAPAPAASDPAALPAAGPTTDASVPADSTPASSEPKL
jgi:Sec-independent protein translocase protein TatA